MRPRLRRGSGTLFLWWWIQGCGYRSPPFSIRIYRKLWLGRHLHVIRYELCTCSRGRLIPTTVAVGCMMVIMRIGFAKARQIYTLKIHVAKPTEQGQCIYSLRRLLNNNICMSSTYNKRRALRPLLSTLISSRHNTCWRCATTKRSQRRQQSSSSPCTQQVGREKARAQRVGK